MMKNMILSEIYTAITTASEILTPEFINELLDKVLPICDSDADDKAVKEEINKLYRNFPEVRDKIGNLFRKNLDDYDATSTPGYETITNNYPDIKKLEASLKKRLNKNQHPTPDAKN